VTALTCITCQAICCDFHLIHDRHKYFVSEAILLRQKQAIAQRDITAPAVAPAKDTNSGIESTTKKAAKKNSWADLQQRFEIIKGKPYAKPHGQRVGDFQLMVEGLEGPISSNQETTIAQSKEGCSHPSPTQVKHELATPARINSSSLNQSEKETESRSSINCFLNIKHFRPYPLAII